MKFFVYAIAATVAIVTGQTLMSQSPIDLPVCAKPVANTGNFSIAFSTASAVVSHEGTTVRATWSAGPHSHLTVNGNVYQSLQLHGHAPSEHTIGGKQYPFEVHVLHSDKDNNLAVVHTLSKAQLKQWSNVIHLPNAREIQDLNGRVVTLTRAHSVC
ncbi:hypothetical protein H257_18193 [Aphanomyces astaci]|uniref:Carbonic anhydrase n=1 Tax=Aphanomyces astaci TaxID=112090 RepID=W4FC26_APHAT|nr:hypothetical protein H257_18193 [Aphanomyces astaci]ETV65020.1 hypothetical protein H257_18193 [Aphanomyces astaci]|eukprot:XP_009845510.1 hypothetical protein H257_18193 [Aphanomyces astaci]